MTKIAALGALVLFAGTVANAQDVPKFYADTYPSHALDEAMALQESLGGEEAALDAKTRELIALGVAAQIPCQYCVYAHTRGAQAAGATEAELKEAVAAAADVRHWSTVLNGMAYDFPAFRQEFDTLVPTN